MAGILLSSPPPPASKVLQLCGVGKGPPRSPLSRGVGGSIPPLPEARGDPHLSQSPACLPAWVTATPLGSGTPQAAGTGGGRRGPCGGWRPASPQTHPCPCRNLAESGKRGLHLNAKPLTTPKIKVKEKKQIYFCSVYPSSPPHPTEQDESSPPPPHTRPEKKDTISLEDFFKINLPIQRSPRAKISPCPDLTFFPTPRPPLLLLPSLLICSCPRGRLCFTHLPFNAEKPQRDNRKGDFYFRLANAHPQGGKKPRGGFFSHVFEEGKSTQELFGSLVACRSLRKPWRTGRKTTFFFFFFFFCQ